MNQSSQPLNTAEMEELDDFLLYRGHDSPDETYVKGRDEGVLNIAELDGYFTAIVSGPEAIVPSRWMPQVWGDVEPEWESPKAFERIFQLMIRHMNGVVTTLLESDYEFEPIFIERESGGERFFIVEEWCMGYMRGVSLLVDRWNEAGEEMQELLGPIEMFSGEDGWAELHTLPREAVVKLQQEIPGTAQAIYDYWLDRRSDQERVKTIVNEAPKVGRNDPCPCGSGKKFKKCCLH
ncbi:MAG: UPF0149 family protein [Candidatus Sedimenticola sp. (ex Thyasira tokunagai)]